MKAIKLFFRKFLYVTKRVIPTLINEFNKKDGYSFSTNFSKEDEEFYRKIHNKLGTDYRIEDNATDCLGRPVNSCLALYVRGDYNYEKFYKAYYKYEDNKRNNNKIK